MERVRIGDVLRPDRVPVQPDPIEVYVTIGVRSFGRGVFHYEPAAGDKLGRLRFFVLYPRRLVVSNIKGWEGAVAISTETDAGCIASNRFLIYDTADDRIDLDWARWFLLSEPGNALIQRASPGSADRNRTLSVKRFEDLVIPLPPIDEQRNVAVRLDRARHAADRVGGLAKRSDALSVAFAAACASASDIRVDAKVQRGWQHVQLGEVLTRSHQQAAVDANSSYPNVGIYGFGRGLFEKPPIQGDATSARTLFPIRAGQFIYSRLFAFEGAYASVPKIFDGYYVSNEFPSFDTDSDRLEAAWLANYLRSTDRWADLAATSIGLGVRRQRVPVDAVLAHEVLLPPIDEQRAMVRSIQSVEAIRTLQTRSATHVAATVRSLLNQEFGAGT